jgi:rod shape-determining protein MreD
MSSRQLLLAIFYLAAGLFLSVLQSSVFPRLGFSNLSPDLHYVLIISLPLTLPIWMGTVIAVSLGIITDTFLLTSTGFHAVGFLCFYFILVYLQQTIYFDHLLFKAFLAALGYFSLFLLQQIFLAGHTAPYSHFQLGNGVGAAVATGIFAIPLLHVLQIFNRGNSTQRVITPSRS